MPRNQRNSRVLGDANNRANVALVRPVVGQKQSENGPTPSMPNFAEFVALSGANQLTSKTSRPVSQTTAAAAASRVAGNAPKTATGAGKKRKAETTLEEDIAAYKQNLDHIISPNAFDEIPTCKVVRGRINKLVDSGIMNKSEFAKAIGASPNTLNRFLQASGPMGGSGSTVWKSAWGWFKQRDFAKLKMPDVKKRQKLEAADAASGKSSNPKTTAAAAAAVPLPDISDIHLPGEEDDDVEVYDTCDEVRRKINAHLTETPGLTQTQFCRDLYAQLRAPRCKSIQSKQLADFRAMKGARTGARSSVFYAAYVYFEKLRVAQGKPKTAHRLNMESVWEAEGGFDRENDHRTRFILSASASVHFDQYGRTRIY
ncbi:hypothetical protein F5Y09DRAFT_322810 [Xylaria sp. FL1042]|nr:hypothetical protein F5Y09DRAFT_322810 [Xylaria sp. FL1042]